LSVRPSLARWALLAALAAGACRQIMGIEDATLDPSLGGDAAGATTKSPSVEQGAADQGGGASIGGAVPAAGEGSTVDDEAGDAGAQASPPAEGGAGGAASELGVCEQYCSAVQSNCTGSFAVYTSMAVCLAVCAALPEGALGDRDVNSVRCRLRAAEAAVDEVPHYCPIAGPGGGGVCGTNCESLCALKPAICGELSAQSANACRKECAALTDLGGYSTALEHEHYAGAHVQCRLYHLSAAAIEDPERHCSHADGAAPCQ
jgi:hypothetical protein